MGARRRTEALVPLRLFLCSHGSKEYAAYREQVCDRYRDAHGAELDSFHPEFLVLQDAEGTTLGLAGIRSADAGPLFLENYFDASIERLIHKAEGPQIGRERIAEIGNFVSFVPGGMQLLFRYLEAVLESMDFQCAVFTGTKVLRRGLERAGYQLLDLGEADPTRLHGAADNWGNYYKNQPRVCALFSRSIADDRRVAAAPPCIWSRHGKSDERVA